MHDTVLWSESKMASDASHVWKVTVLLGCYSHPAVRRWGTRSLTQKDISPFLVPFSSVSWSPWYEQISYTLTVSSSTFWCLVFISATKKWLRQIVKLVTSTQPGSKWERQGEVARVPTFSLKGTTALQEAQPLNGSTSFQLGHQLGTNALIHKHYRSIEDPNHTFHHITQLILVHKHGIKTAQQRFSGTQGCR